jgi:hypothetical protein
MTDRMGSRVERIPFAWERGNVRQSSDPAKLPGCGAVAIKQLLTPPRPVASGWYLGTLV